MDTNVMVIKEETDKVWNFNLNAYIWELIIK